MAVLASQLCSSGVAALRDLEYSHVVSLVGYWYDGGADFRALAVNPAALPDREVMTARFHAAIRTGDPSQSKMGYAVTLNDALIGYTLLNQYSPASNYSHWHIIEKTLRKLGISSLLYPHRLDVYFRTSNIRRLVHQTHVSNLGVNRMLDKYVPVAETKWLDRPDGLGSPGKYHLRYVTNDDVADFLTRAQTGTR